MKWGAEVCPSGVPGIHWPGYFAVWVLLDQAGAQYSAGA